MAEYVYTQEQVMLLVRIAQADAWDRGHLSQDFDTNPYREAN